MGGVTAVLHLFPEVPGRSLVPPPRSALLQHPLHDVLLVGQPVDGEDVEPAQDHDAEGTGPHGQPGPRELPGQYCHGPSGCVPPGEPAGAHRSPRVPGRWAGGRARVSTRRPAKWPRRAPPTPVPHAHTPSAFFLAEARASLPPPRPQRSA